jgi:hypothetical protein
MSLTPGAFLRPLALATPAKPRPPVDPLAITDPREAALFEALKRELEVGRAYRDETLGIAALAGVPPHGRERRLV